MGDVWRSKEPRYQRRNRALGTIDGRLRNASPVPPRSVQERPKDDARSVQFNSGGPVTSGSVSPPYIVPQDSILEGLFLSVESGGVRADVFVNGSKKASITHSGASGFGTHEDLDIDLEADDEVSASFTTTSGSPEGAVLTVSILED